MLGALGNPRRVVAAFVASLSLAACTSTLSRYAPTQPLAPISPFQAIVAPANLFPDAQLTGPTGIRGSLLSATIKLANGRTDGALENLARGTWTAINVPGAASTAAYGPAVAAGGYRVVGSFTDAGSKQNRGFIFDAAAGSYTVLQPPRTLCAPRSCNEVIAHSVYGRHAFVVVGNYDTLPSALHRSRSLPASGHAFLYRSSSHDWQNIDVAHAISTTAYGVWIDGGDIIVAGGYANAGGDHAYVRDLTTQRLLTYNFPGAIVTHFEGLSGAGGLGNFTLAGDFVDPGSATLYGFFLPVSNWQAGAPIVLGALSANSVSGRVVVGIMKSGSAAAGYLVHVPG